MSIIDAKVKKNFIVPLTQAESASEASEYINKVFDLNIKAIQSENIDMINWSIRRMELVRNVVQANATPIKAPESGVIVKKLTTAINSASNSALATTASTVSSPILDYIKSNVPTVASLVAAASTQNPFLAGAIKHVGDKIQSKRAAAADDDAEALTHDRKSNSAELQDVSNQLNTEKTNGAVVDNIKTPQTNISVVDNIKTPQTNISVDVAREDTLHELAIETEKQTDILANLLTYTIETWGDNSKTLTDILAENQHNAEQLTNLYKLERTREREDAQEESKNEFANSESTLEAAQEPSIPAVLVDTPQQEDEDKAASGILGKMSGLFKFGKLIPIVGAIVGAVTAITSALDTSKVASLFGKGEGDVTLSDRIHAGITGIVSMFGSLIDMFTSIFGFETDVKSAIEEFMVGDNFVADIVRRISDGWAMIIDIVGNMVSSMFSGITGFFSNDKETGEQGLGSKVIGWFTGNDAEATPEQTVSKTDPHSNADAPIIEPVQTTSGVDMKRQSSEQAKEKIQREVSMSESRNNINQTAVNNTNINNTQIMQQQQRSSFNTESTIRRNAAFA